MANNKSFKIKNGLSATRYLQSAGADGAGSEAYSLAGASYDSVSLSSTEESNPISIVFKPDGTKVYFAGGTKDVHQFDFTTAWDLSTASFASKSKDVGAPEGGTAYNPIDLIFSSDGTKLWVFSNRASSTEVYQWNLSTAWDISTASYASIKKDLTGVSDTGAAIQFNSDGTVLVVGHTNGTLAHWDLSTAYNVSTATEATSKRTSLSGVSNLRSIHFKSNGTSLFILHGGSDREVREFSLSTAYDITTASLESDTFNYGSQETSANDLEFKPDGNKMYIIGSNGDSIYQYSTVGYTQTLDLSTGTSFSFTPSDATTVSFTNPPASGIAIGFAVEINGDGSAITWPSSVKWPSGTAPTATASKELYTFITVDGGTTYYGKLAGSNIA